MTLSRLLSLAVTACLVAAPAGRVRAGVADTPLPTFADGQPAKFAAFLPTVVSDNNLRTYVMCTNLGTTPVDVGLEVFDSGGTRGNTIATGNGALLAAVQANKLCVGVDVDQFVSYTDADKCLLTSAEKHIAFAVTTSITWPANGLLTFDATNAGVGISPFHNYDSQVPADVKTMVADALKKLADGTLKTGYTG